MVVLCQNGKILTSLILKSEKMTPPNLFFSFQTVLTFLGFFSSITFRINLPIPKKKRNPGILTGITHLVEWLTFKNSENIQCWWGCGSDWNIQEFSCENTKWYSYSGKEFGSFFCYMYTYHIIQSSCLLVYYDQRLVYKCLWQLVTPN